MNISLSQLTRVAGCYVSIFNYFSSMTRIPVRPGAHVLPTLMSQNTLAGQIAIKQAKTRFINIYHSLIVLLT